MIMQGRCYLRKDHHHWHCPSPSPSPLPASRGDKRELVGDLPALAVVPQQGEVGDSKLVIDGAMLELLPIGMKIWAAEVAEGDGEVGMKTPLLIAAIAQSTGTVQPVQQGLP